MSNVFDLDSIREELDKEFAPAIFKKGNKEFVLRNLMRVGKKDRTQIITLMKELQTTQGDNESVEDIDDPEEIERLQDLLAELLSIVTADGQGPSLVEAVGDDIQMLSKVMEYWQEATDAGEAEDSPS